MSKFAWGGGAVISAALLGAAYYMFSGQAEVEHTSLSVSRDSLDAETVIFSWSGPVAPPMARQFQKEFKNWKAQTSRVIIKLDSPGGSVDEGERVIKHINTIKKTHNVWTYVGADSECLSMCVPIYLQGRTRVAAPESTWLFHDAQARDVVTGTPTIMYSNERSQANLMFTYKYIDRSEINPKWREKLKRDLQLGDVWKTGQELKDERSNIVMILE